MAANTQLFEELQADYEMSDPGTGKAIIPDRQRAVCPLVTGATGETNTLPDPDFMGQELTICMKTDGGGDRVVTASTAINQPGNNTITFSDAGEFIARRAIQKGSSVVWRQIQNAGAALSTV